MALKEIDEAGGTHEVPELPYRAQHEAVMGRLAPGERAAMEAEVHARLDRLLALESATGGGAITNTSIEGGRPSPLDGVRGNWRGTPFQPLFDLLQDDQLAGMVFGNVWKSVLIGRDEVWVGIRADPTFPNRGITLQGKTYFLDRSAGGSGG